MPDTDMMTRVARAIDPFAFDGGTHGPECHECESRREEARRMARAALSALREPTEAMLAAGAVAEGDGNLEAQARNIWAAMIEAALTDTLSQEER